MSQCDYWKLHSLGVIKRITYVTSVAFFYQEIKNSYILELERLLDNIVQFFWGVGYHSNK